MIRDARPWLALLAALAFGPTLSACNAEPTAEPTEVATAEPPTEAPVPTPVARMEPTATPTVDPEAEPLAPVGSEELEGIVIPAAAELVEYVEPTDETDARADYRIEAEGVDSEALYDWFVTELTARGWAEPEDRDGSLIFLHETQLSQRFAELGQKRTATVIFDLTEGVDFSILAEAPD